MRPPLTNLSVFFPAYYDEHNINRLIPKAVSVLEELNLDQYEILIIEDGSPDNTAQVADDLARQFPSVRVIHHPTNQGYGATLKDGFKQAQYDWIFYTDGDCQFDIKELKKFVALQPYTDVVIGFRQTKQYSPFRQFTSWAYNQLVQGLFKLDVIDVNCAYKLIPRTLLADYTITAQHGFIDAEILLRARRLKYTITQVGVTHLPRTEGVAAAARPEVVFNTFLETIRFRLTDRA